MPKIIDLRPKQDLLNSKFETYKFSSDIIPIIREESLVKNVFRQEPSDGQDSWLEAKLFAFHNHLFKNPFDSSCWFCDKDLQVWQLQTNGELSLRHTLSPKSNNKIRYNPTISFASDKVLVLTNGEGSLEVLHLTNSDKFQPFNHQDIEPGILLDSHELKNDSKLLVALYCVINVEKTKQSKLVFLSYTINKSTSTIELVQKQELSIKGPIEYAYIESSGMHLNILSQAPAIFTYDSLNQIQNDEPKMSQNSSMINIPKYSWSQDEDSLTIWIKIPQKHKNSRPIVKIRPTTLSLSIDNEVLIQGEFQYRVDDQTATWNTKDETLKLDVMKHECGQMWNELILGDTHGECLPNEALAAEIHSRLSHLCTDQPNSSGEQPTVGFNAAQLEECDVEGKDNYLQRINLSSHATTHLAMLSAHNRLLFTYKLDSCQVLCTRHDYDGCVWHSADSDESDKWEMIHTSTFPGLGYVEASKRNKKFCISPSNCSYVAIIEHTRHGFLYEQPAPGAEIAKQKIIDLGVDATSIMGAAAMTDLIILLTKDKIYQLKIN